MQGLFAFVDNRSGWVQLGQTIVGATGSFFGEAVALSFNGRVVVVGGPFYNEGFFVSIGHARAFRLTPDDTLWEQIGNVLVGESFLDQFGISAAISNDGSRIAIGGRWNDGNGADSGFVKVYQSV